jgi:two-component system phosphate regulon sensor histidine kinase PhoR
MQKLSLSRNFMILAIVLLAAFQTYWLTKLYKDEFNSLKKEVDVTFRETIYKLQKQRFEKDSFLSQQLNSELNKNLKNAKVQEPIFINRVDKNQPKKPALKWNKNITISSNLNDIDPSTIDSVVVRKNTSAKKLVLPPEFIEVFLKQKALGDSTIIIKKDSLGNTSISRMSYSQSYSYTTDSNDSIPDFARTKKMILEFKDKAPITPKKITDIKITNFSFNGYPNEISKDSSSPVIRFFSRSKSINDSLPVYFVDSAYKAELSKSNKPLQYKILFKECSKEDVAKAELKKDSSKDFATSNVLIGFTTPYSYQAKFDNIFSFIIQKMGWQIAGSLLLLSFVIASFISLYRNLMEQKQLANMKNEFISNITHELKTPIATVNVAIEALRNFGGITSPEKTKEYLDISASELQRLSLLVDKVLKLSMFENKEVELNKELFDIKNLTEEVMNTMKLQFEKQHIAIALTTSGESFTINADKLHITSVVYNLLDNALKYSKSNGFVKVHIEQQNQALQFQVIDNGIGIAEEYQSKVFDKFFRVPSGNVHNTKGYGLGLSYVAHIVHKHKGSITVQSELGKGSCFTVIIPTN